eukprot:NODE_14931_length_1077_cov_3.008421.p1 GENE.NODE_14931_length_1077_cov_3.008421~~NODE_14931_length_1077_cov_3.008421.p1  ORF type:complete len:200 (-),score=69.84 NODE_14931_length_1077_cov_3.008421:346-945(-)
MQVNVDGMEQTRYKTMLDSLQNQDAEIEAIVVFSKFVVAYLLQQDGPNPGWRKANIEGPLYLVRRRSMPRYQLLVKNQFSTNDLLDAMHADWELDCQKNYIFYKVEDPTKRIRGLWFHDDVERQKMESVFEKTLEDIRQKGVEPQLEPPPRKPDISGEAGDETVAVSRDAMRGALHALADDDEFLSTVMQRLREHNHAR